MEIEMHFHSSWRASFLEEENETNRFKRKFNASSKSTSDHSAHITKSTVLGVLCRLIGDQRKLFQAQASNDYFFKDIEHLITFSEKIMRIGNPIETDETIMLINKSEKRCAQSNFIGTIDENCPAFFSEYAAWFWSVFDKDFETVLDFIIEPDKFFNPAKELSRIQISHLMQQIDYIYKLPKFELYEPKLKQLENKLKTIETSVDKKDIKKATKLKEEIENLKQQQDYLSKMSFKILQASEKIEAYLEVVSKDDYIDEKSQSAHPMGFYAAALYIQVKQMELNGLDIKAYAKEQKKEKFIPGFSKKGFNGHRDLFQRFTNQGNNTNLTKTPKKIKKASGKIFIYLDIGKEKSIELKKLIDNAAVSSFYLGKKGLAYVTNIRV